MNDTELNHTLLRLLAENVPHRVYAKDPAGRFIFANRAVAHGMGVNGPQDLLGKTDFDFYPHEDAARYFAQEQEVMRTGQAMLNHEEQVNYLLLGEESWLVTTKIPLFDDEGHALGLVGINYDVTPRKRAEQALSAANRQAEAAQRELEQTVARLHLEMRERERVETELRQRAWHDHLTGLPNRALLMDRLEEAIVQAQRGHHSMTLLFLDLDHFKDVNDHMGHAVGDELLKLVSRRVGSCVRLGDTLARLGGDEFVLLLPNAMGDEALNELIGRIAESIEQPISLGGRNLGITCSIGCARFPRDGTCATTLLQHADAHMYRSKQEERRHATRGKLPV